MRLIGGRRRRSAEMEKLLHSRCVLNPLSLYASTWTISLGSNQPLCVQFSVPRVCRNCFHGCVYCTGRQSDGLAECLSIYRITVQYSKWPLFRGGSRTLQGRVSNPSERGTGGRAPTAPRRVGLGRGLCPLARKFLHFLYLNGEFLCIPRDI